MLIAIAAIILIVISLFLIVYKKNLGTKEAFPTRKIRLFYADWCGHCKMFMPDWNKFTEYANKNFSDLVVEKINGDSNKESVKKLIQEEGVDGFPTVIFYNNNKKIRYEGERNMQSLVEFIKNNQSL